MQFDWALFIPGTNFPNDLGYLFCHAAIIEHVRDGSVVRALLLPDYYLVTVMLSGIKVRPYIGYRVGLGLVEVFIQSGRFFYAGTSDRLFLQSMGY